MNGYLGELFVDQVYPHLLPPAIILYPVEPAAYAVEPIGELADNSEDGCAHNSNTIYIKINQHFSQLLTKVVKNFFLQLFRTDVPRRQLGVRPRARAESRSVRGERGCFALPS